MTTPNEAKADAQAMLAQVTEMLSRHTVVHFSSDVVGHNQPAPAPIYVTLRLELRQIPSNQWPSSGES